MRGSLPYLWVSEWHPGGHGLHVHFAFGRFVRLGSMRFGRGFVHIKLLGTCQELCMRPVHRGVGVVENEHVRPARAAPRPERVTCTSKHIGTRRGGRAGHQVGCVGAVAPVGDLGPDREDPHPFRAGSGSGARTVTIASILAEPVLSARKAWQVPTLPARALLRADRRPCHLDGQAGRPTTAGSDSSADVGSGADQLRTAAAWERLPPCNPYVPRYVAGRFAFPASCSRGHRPRRKQRHMGVSAKSR